MNGVLKKAANNAINKSKNNVLFFRISKKLLILQILFFVAIVAGIIIQIILGIKIDNQILYPIIEISSGVNFSTITIIFLWISLFGEGKYTEYGLTMMELRELDKRNRYKMLFMAIESFITIFLSILFALLFFSILSLFLSILLFYLSILFLCIEVPLLVCDKKIMKRIIKTNLVLNCKTYKKNYDKIVEMRKKLKNADNIKSEFTKYEYTNVLINIIFSEPIDIILSKFDLKADDDIGNKFIKRLLDVQLLELNKLTQTTDMNVSWNYAIPRNTTLETFYANCFNNIDWILYDYKNFNNSKEMVSESFKYSFIIETIFLMHQCKTSLKFKNNFENFFKKSYLNLSKKNISKFEKTDEIFKLIILIICKELYSGNLYPLETLRKLSSRLMFSEEQRALFIIISGFIFYRTNDTIKKFIFSNGGFDMQTNETYSSWKDILFKLFTYSHRFVKLEFILQKFNLLNPSTWIPFIIGVNLSQQIPFDSFILIEFYLECLAYYKTPMSYELFCELAIPNESILSQCTGKSITWHFQNFLNHDEFKIISFFIKDVITKSANNLVCDYMKRYIKENKNNGAAFKNNNNFDDEIDQVKIITEIKSEISKIDHYDKTLDLSDVSFCQYTYITDKIDKNANPEFENDKILNKNEKWIVTEIIQNIKWDLQDEISKNFKQNQKTIDEIYEKIINPDKNKIVSALYDGLELALYEKNNDSKLNKIFEILKNDKINRFEMVSMVPYGDLIVSFGSTPYAFNFECDEQQTIIRSVNTDEAIKIVDNSLKTDGGKYIYKEQGISFELSREEIIDLIKNKYIFIKFVFRFKIKIADDFYYIEELKNNN